MKVRLTIALASVAVLAQTAASAASSNPGYYTPPKLIKRGSPLSPITGRGTVVVKVFVTKNGVASSFTVLRSDNHGDDAAALEVARASTYRAATKGDQKVDAYYDYTLKFNASGLAIEMAPAATLSQYKLMIAAGNYGAARTGLKNYLVAHPADAAAEIQLGIADEYSSDPLEAAGAFDRAGTLPAMYVTVAVHAYDDAAGVAYKKKDFAAAVTFAKKAVGRAPGPFTYNTLGTAEDAAGQSDAAVSDLEKARSLANADPKIGAVDRAKIEANLVSAYLNAGQPDQAKAVAADVGKLDPANASAQSFLASYYARQGNDLAGQQKYADAAAAFEAAAALAPQNEVPSLYANAALTLLKIRDTTPNDRAKADADKALAIDPDNAPANFAAGVALANQPGKAKDALVFLNKADAAAKKSADANLAAAVENVIKQLNGSK